MKGEQDMWDMYRHFGHRKAPKLLINTNIFHLRRELKEAIKDIKLEYYNAVVDFVKNGEKEGTSYAGIVTGLELALDYLDVTASEYKKIYENGVTATKESLSEEEVE